MYRISRNLIHPLDDEMQSEFGHLLKHYSNKYYATLKCNPYVIVEIGVRAGYGADAMLQAAKGAKYYGFDVSDKWEDWARKILGKYDVELDFACDTQKTDNLNVQADLVHVDGDHSYDSTLHDLELAEKTGAKYILVDDYDYLTSVATATHKFLASRDYATFHYKDFRGQLLLQDRRKLV